MSDCVAEAEFNLYIRVIMVTWRWVQHCNQTALQPRLLRTGRQPPDDTMDTRLKRCLRFIILPLNQSMRHQSEKLPTVATAGLHGNHLHLFM